MRAQCLDNLDQLDVSTLVTGQSLTEEGRLELRLGLTDYKADSPVLSLAQILLSVLMT